MTVAIPVQIWLLVIIAPIAIGPARYLYRHVSNAPSRHDITQPPPDLSWRTSKSLVLNLGALVVLIGFAIFIFTPAAVKFAQWRGFFPSLLGAMGTWAFSTVAKGFRSGEIELLVRGFRRSYHRQLQPKRFWASMVWNAVVGGMMFWLVPLAIDDASNRVVEIRCYNEEFEFPPRDELLACVDRLTAALEQDPDNISLLLMRAESYWELGEEEKSKADDLRLSMLRYEKAKQVRQAGNSVP